MTREKRQSSEDGTPGPASSAAIARPRSADERPADRERLSYYDFQVLLDVPADQPGLHFDDYALAFAGLIQHSRAAFAVGIFGGWGSGKTTLMRSIERFLASDEDMVTVWFTAWRYEKEQHLIIPLLDVLREALNARAKPDARSAPGPWVDTLAAGSGAPGGPSGQAWARRAASGIAKAGQAFVAGLTLSAGLPGIQVDFRPGDAASASNARRDDSAKPLSFYHAGFVELREAIAGLSADGRRLVVFVDDLDRCLPPSALEMLESMKLFFDAEGCIFVAGLDAEIVERAVAERFRLAGADDQPEAYRTASYVSKIFQVPFALPPMRASQLRGYLDAIEANSGFSDEQKADFQGTVRPHLAFLERMDTINPREIKRLINSYTLQLKMLSAQLGSSLEPHVVLALLCMNFRPDWRPIYSAMAADPSLFQATMRDALAKRDWPASIWLSGTPVALPHEFLDYLRSSARPLLTTEHLQWYVFAAESTWSIDPSVLEARTIVSRLRQAVDDVSEGRLRPTDSARSIPIELDRLYNLVSSLRGLLGRPHAIRQEVLAAVAELRSLAQELVPADGQAPADPRPSEFLEAWTPKVARLFDTLDNRLRELHQYVSVVP